MFLFGNEIKDFDELVAVVEEEISSDSYWVDDIDGSLPSIDDVSDLHDLLEGWVSEDDLSEFESILDEGQKSFEGIEFETGDSMYHMSGGGFSSWGDYYRYRFG